VLVRVTGFVKVRPPDVKTDSETLIMVLVVKTSVKLASPPTRRAASADTFVEVELEVGVPDDEISPDGGVVVVSSGGF
jgi:hypothetical protein